MDTSQSGSSGDFKGKTESNGCFVARGRALIGVYARFSASGYYPATIRREDLHLRPRSPVKEVDPIRWDCQRWDAEYAILLKRIRNPIPLQIGSLDTPHVSPYEGVGKYCLGRTSSYDIVKGAFLPPYGQGEVADLQFTWKMTIYTKGPNGVAEDYDTRCEVRMTNVVDGLQRGNPDGGKGECCDDGSAYISAYEAPLNGYTNEIALFRNVRGRHADSNDDRHFLYYFRIRTQTNESGEITNALYGKIYGQINGNFSYLLNMTPSDRNIEERRKSF